jgi:hypothetical protein
MSIQENVMAYSEDLKQRVLAFVAAGGSKVEAAKLFSLAEAACENSFRFCDINVGLLVLRRW